MIDLDKVRAALPMPELIVKLGVGDKAHAKAICPWHDDKNPSFGIFEKEGRWWFKCHAGCGQGDEVDLLQKVLAIGTKGEAIRQSANLAGIREERAATVAKRKGMTPRAPLSWAPNYSLFR
jgi:DNA primase